MPFIRSTAAWLNARRIPLLALGVCMVFGAGISVLPHLLQWGRTGDWGWVASYDELVFYYPIGSKAYFNHPWSLSDPSTIGPGVTGFPWIQFTPFVLVARLFELGPLGLGPLWRVWAGASMGAGIFLVLWPCARRPVWCTLITLTLLADTGFIWAKPWVWQLPHAWQVLGDATPAWMFSSHPVLLLQWRLITPGLSLFFLLAHLALVHRARQRHPEAFPWLAGASLGLVVHAYFYFWTAAFLGLGLCWLADREGRRVYWRTGLLGGLLGLPDILVSGYIKNHLNSDWLPRTDKFIPIPHFSELILWKAAWLLLIVLGIWVWRRRRDLLPLGFYTLASGLLLNHQIITGLQIENSHWNYVFGPGICLLVAAACLTRLPGLADSRRWPGRLVTLLAVTHLGLGLVLRHEEWNRSAQTREIMEGLARYRQQSEAQGRAALEPNQVVAGDTVFLDWAVVLDNLRAVERQAFFSANVPDALYDRHLALNAYVLGERPETFKSRQATLLDNTPGGLIVRDPRHKAERLQTRIKAFARITADPEAALAEFKVRYLALPAGQSPPEPVAGNSQLLQSGPHWSVWEWMGTTKRIP